MKTIQSVRITKTEGSADKEYRIHLIETNGAYLVNYQNGKRGGTLANGTKTKEAVTKDEADKLYNSTLKSKLKDGYVMDGAVEVAPLAVVVKEKTATKVKLLNEIKNKIELRLFINNPKYGLQQKFDGERRSVNKTATNCVGGNKKNETVAVDAEIVASFRELNDIEVDAEQIGSMLYVFDILRYNKKDLSTKPYRERLAILNTITFGKNVVVAKTAYTKEEKESLLKEMEDTNAEGVVVVELDATYISGRNSTCLKFKFYKTATVKVSSLTKGKRSVQMSVEENGKFIDVGAVTIPVNKEIPEVNDFIEVRYLYAYKGGSLFQPTFLFSRADADDSDCSINQLAYKQEMVEA